MTGHEIAKAFVTLAQVTEERDALRAALAEFERMAAAEARKEYWKGYRCGYGARKRTEGNEGAKPYSRLREVSDAA